MDGIKCCTQCYTGPFHKWLRGRGGYLGGRKVHSHEDDGDSAIDTLEERVVYMMQSYDLVTRMGRGRIRNNETTNL